MSERVQFSVWSDAEGNLYMQGGTLVDRSSSPSVIWTLDPAGDGPVPAARVGIEKVSRGGASGYRFSEGVGLAEPAAGEHPAPFAGGSGRNVRMAGTLSGTAAPLGYFTQTDADVWTDGHGYTITLNGDGSSDLEDATDVIASTPAATSTAAPYGTFTLSSYGETTYNGGSSGTITGTFEGRILFPDATVTMTAGATAQDGAYSSTAWGEWESDTDSNWTIAVDANGDGVINDGTDDVATIAGAPPGVAAGVFQSTTYGETNYNSGDEFEMTVVQDSVATMSGYLYVTISLSGGTPTGLSGPIFAAAMPSNSATEEHVPIAYSDGTSVLQIHEGPIVFL